MDVFDKCREKMAGGQIPACQQLVKAGRCDGCCNVGAVLFEGEELRYIPEGVQVIGRKVKNCLGKNGCAFDGDHTSDKPVMCMLGPSVCSFVSEFTGRRTAVHCNDEATLAATGCLAAFDLPPDFVENVSGSVGLLVDAGIWDKECGPSLPPATADEVVTVFEYNLVSAWLSRGIRKIVDLFSSGE